MSYQAAISAFLLFSGQGTLLAVLSVFLVPGYLVVGAIFPSGEGITWTERCALSLGLSVAVTSSLGLMLGLSGLGISFIAVAAVLVGMAFPLWALAFWRRMHLAIENRLSGSIVLKKPDWAGYTGTEKALATTLVAGVVCTVVASAYLITLPFPGGRFTEFYILGPSGNPSGYPKCLNVSQPGDVLIGLTNHEFGTLDYSVRIDQVGEQVVYNSTKQSNETVEVNRTVVSWLNLTLNDGQNRTEPFVFVIQLAGLWKMQFTLFRNRDLSEAYLALHLFVRVPCN